MTVVRALCVPSASGHKNRGLPKTTSPENPWSVRRIGDLNPGGWLHPTALAVRRHRPD